MTPDEIKIIQDGGIDWNGWPLKKDGDLGSKTNWWMGITSLHQQRQDILKIALGYHAAGMDEDPSIENGGTFVNMLFKDGKTGLVNQPWCAAFASHCYKKAGVPFPKYFTSAWQFIDWAERTGKLVDKPLPADIVAYLHPKKPGDTQWKGHVEVNIACDDTWVWDVGGNISNAVRVGKRLIKPEMKFIRILDGAHGPLSLPTNAMRLDSLKDR